MRSLARGHRACRRGSQTEGGTRPRALLAFSIGTRRGVMVSRRVCGVETAGMFVQVSNAYPLVAVPPAVPGPVQLPVSLLPNSKSESRVETRFQVKQEALRGTSQRVMRGSGTLEAALARLQASIKAKEALV